MAMPQHQAIEQALLLALVASVLLQYLAPDAWQTQQSNSNSSSPQQLPSMTLGLNGVGLMLLLAHRWRWELLAAYIAIALFAASQHNATAHWFDNHAILRYVQIALAFVGLFMSRMFPLPDFSQLDGEYQTIGCFYQRIGGVECRVFYPSAKDPPSSPTDKRRIAYLHHGDQLLKGMQHYLPVPMWVMSNFHNAYLAALEKVPIAPPPTKAGWPVVFFSHGLAGSLELYSAVNQQLASGGNIVVVLNHADGSASVACPDDQHVEYYRHPPRLPSGEWEMPAAMDMRRDQLKFRLGELHRVVDALKQLNKQEPATYQGKVFSSMDLSHMILAGHSFGGATMLTAAHLDTEKQFCAAFVLDSWMEPIDPAVIQGLGDRIPVLHLVSQNFADDMEWYKDMVTHIRGCTHPNSRMMVIRGSKHNNFSDLPVFFAPWVDRKLGMSGEIDPQYMLHLIGKFGSSFLRDINEFNVIRKQYPEAVDVQ